MELGPSHRADSGWGWTSMNMPSMPAATAALARGAGEGQTHTLDQSLLQLLEAKLITAETAQSAAASPGDLMRQANLKRMLD